MKRLLLALLTVCLALPAAAMPLAHALPAGQAMAVPHAEHAATQERMNNHHSAPAPADHHGNGTTKHECIGCIAPYTGAVAVPVRGPVLPIALRPGPSSALVPAATLPETPPPKP